MTADVIHFPNSGLPEHPICKVKIHYELDDTFVVAMYPVPAGAAARKVFDSEREAFPYAGALAKKHAAVHINGNPSWSVWHVGPEEVA